MEAILPDVRVGSVRWSRWREAPTSGAESDRPGVYAVVTESKVCASTAEQFDGGREEGTLDMYM